jgi:mono/diheme cytochrome c family protein
MLSGYVPDVRTLRRRVACLSAAAACLVVVAGCGGDDDSGAREQRTSAGGPPEAPEVEQPLSQAQLHGRELFVQRCGSCHTLDAAGTVGQIGPDLDDISITEEDVRRAIMIGGRGSGNMPPNIVTGQDARDVASFVAVSAGGSATP